MMHKMWSLYLAILSVTFTVYSVSSDSISEYEVMNLLAIGTNDEPFIPFMELYEAESNNWKTLPTAIFDIKDYGVAMYKNRLLLIGGLHHSNENLTNVVNEFDLLSGQIETVSYLNKPRKNPSVAVVGEGESSTLYVIGGEFENGEVTKTVERWDESTQKWKSAKPMINACENAAVVVHNDNIYVIGGFDGVQYTNTVQVYNVMKDKWSIKNSMDLVRGHFHGVSDGKYIFVVGGFNKYSDPNSGLNRIDRYDPENDVWTTVTNIDHCSGSIGFILLKDQFYAVGGTDCARTQIYHQNNNTWQYLDSLIYDRFSHTIIKVPFELKDYDFDWKPERRSMKDILVFGPVNEEIKHKMEVYIPEEERWRKLDHKETNTSWYTAAFLNDRLIIAGGKNTLDPGQLSAASRKVFEINFETGKVLPLSPLNFARNDAQSVAVGEGKSARLYVIGGITSSAYPTKSVERYDPFTDDWESVSSMNYDRSSVSAVYHKGKIYVFGGYTSVFGDLFPYTTNYNEVYLIDENKWEIKAPMIHNLTFTSAVSDGKYIYVVGGKTASYGTSKLVQRYDPSTDTWKMVANTTSEGRMGITLMDNSPIVFGGGKYAVPENLVEIYDPVKDEWKKLASMNYGRDIFAALQIPWKWKHSKYSKYYKYVEVLCDNV